MYTLLTRHPIAVDSLDHLEPRGSMHDNTHCEGFVKQCERALPQARPLHFLDLGCAGGGLVADFLKRGHEAIGLEGSDYSLLSGRAEWKDLANKALFTCDITKPFQLLYNDARAGNVLAQPTFFDIISAWEVMEHISEEDLPQVLLNIRNHLKPYGFFACSVSDKPDYLETPEGLKNYHQTVKEYHWWGTLFTMHGFSIALTIQSMFRGRQWPRGPGSQWNDPGYHFVLQLA